MWSSKNGNYYYHSVEINYVCLFVFSLLLNLVNYLCKAVILGNPKAKTVTLTLLGVEERDFYYRKKVLLNSNTYG